MFSMCSELTPRARIPDTRIPQFMQPCLKANIIIFVITSVFTPLTLIRLIQLGKEFGGCFDFR